MTDYTKEVHNRIREVLKKRPDLKYKDKFWPEKQQMKVRKLKKEEKVLKLNKFQGFCYVATHAFCYLVPEARPYRDKEGTHYWAQIGDEIWDLTKEQFNFEFPYHEGVKIKKQVKPTKRVQEILNELV